MARGSNEEKEDTMGGPGGLPSRGDGVELGWPEGPGEVRGRGEL